MPSAAAACNSSINTLTYNSGYPFTMYEALPAMAPQRLVHFINFSCSFDSTGSAPHESRSVESCEGRDIAICWKDPDDVPELTVLIAAASRSSRETFLVVKDMAWLAPLKSSSRSVVRSKLMLCCSSLSRIPYKTRSYFPRQTERRPQYGPSWLNALHPPEVHRRVASADIHETTKRTKAARNPYCPYP